MARKPRRELIDASSVGAYHVISRCVRRAFLMGYDAQTRQQVSHRRDWIRSRLEFLAGIFMIDVLAYSVLSNHYHVILRNRPDLARSLSDRDVAMRFWRLEHETDGLYTPRRRSSRRRYPKVRERKLAAMIADRTRMEEYRRRLSSISWFMNHLNHSIALRANEEDKTSGRFWEGRFVSEPIETLEQLFSALVYVDLNPIRAGLALTPEECTHTSIFERLTTLRRPCGEPIDWARSPSARRQPRAERSKWVQLQQELDDWLSPIDERDEPPAASRGRSPFGAPPDPTRRVDEVLAERQPPRASDKGCLPMTAHEYVTLVDWMGRRQRQEQPGRIPADLPPILERLGLESPERWLAIYSEYEKRMARFHRHPVNTPEERSLCQIDAAKDPARTDQAFR